MRTRVCARTRYKCANLGPSPEQKEKRAGRWELGLGGMREAERESARRRRWPADLVGEEGRKLGRIEQGNRRVCVRSVAYNHTGRRLLPRCCMCDLVPKFVLYARPELLATRHTLPMHAQTPILHTYAYTCICINTHTRTHTRTHTQTRTHARTHARAHAHTPHSHHVGPWPWAHGVCVCVCVCVFVK